MAATQRINRIARSLRGKDEERTIDQLRADVYLDLLCGTTHTTTSRGVVDLRVDLDTLTELNNHPGDLAGYGPVIADITRRTAKHETEAEWRYTVTNPTTGQPIHTDVTRRRPTTSQRRTVEARNPTCVFPGCRMPAISSDLDHRTPWADGGPTTETNLGPLCRHDHCIRHQHGWTYQPLPNSDHQWTSRLGHTYTTSGTPPWKRPPTPDRTLEHNKRAAYENTSSTNDECAETWAIGTRAGATSSDDDQSDASWNR